MSLYYINFINIFDYKDLAFKLFLNAFVLIQ